jgi:hypothetical protein
LIGQDSNSYASAIPIGHHGCLLAGERHRFELPEGAIIRPKMKEDGNVYGCGLVLDPDNNLAIFFTLNGQLLCKLELKHNKKERAHVYSQLINLK